MYDLNKDGYISREEMFHMLKNSLIRQLTEEDPDEGIKDLVEIILKKMVCVCACDKKKERAREKIHNRSFTSNIYFGTDVGVQDYDHDSRLSYSDFERAVRNENLLLEAFGSCLPDTKVKITKSTHLWKGVAVT